ncbi:glycosyltransferase family 2 protein [Pedobacter sp. G11]|uniref:glycosyltransferase n=1 Tax=Pedobacter sp. G11 TaxID=2482728 RepID=UPI000F5F31B1|nr:glycosyltransferase [Pedobacter sp. G11]AZI25851.1 glycosyltransferase family 2 protein [Pedobacter sp. G11]
MIARYKPGVSVLICCYNSAARIATTLEYLAKQKDIESIPVEILIIDNASTDDTKAVALNTWNEVGNKNIDFDIRNQPIKGKSYAFKLGVQRASFEFILICDDDNWLDETYISTAFRIMTADRNIGALGGVGIIEAEEPTLISEDLLKRITVHGRQFWAENDHWVYGAGSVYRKNAIDDFFDKGWLNVTTGRKGKSLISGEDVEICYMIYLLGYKITENENLTFKHFVDRAKQSKDFILRISFWLSYSQFLLFSYTDHFSEKKSGLFRFSIGLLRLTGLKIIKTELRIVLRYLTGKGHIDFDQKQRLAENRGLLYSILQNFLKVKRHRKHVQHVLNKGI